MKYLNAVFVALAMMAVSTSASEKYSCGEAHAIRRPYGKVEQRVDCDVNPKQIWVAEFRGDIPHGVAQGFNRKSGWRMDSCFNLNGNRDGRCLYWDSLGNVIGRSFYRKGVPVGKWEFYRAVGMPARIQNYDMKGREQGLQQEWWRNGNKKNELMAKNGVILSGTEYYESGHPRIRYESPYDPKSGVFTQKSISQESWAPDGRPAGKVVKGQGEILLFGDKPSDIHVAAHREVYKDSLMIKLEELDSAEAASWLDTYSKANSQSKQ